MIVEIKGKEYTCKSMKITPLYEDEDGTNRIILYNVPDLDIECGDRVVGDLRVGEVVTIKM